MTAILHAASDASPFAQPVILSTGTVMVSFGPGLATDNSGTILSFPLPATTGGATTGNRPAVPPMSIEELEDRIDIAAARAALAESEQEIPLEDVRRALGLS